MSVRKLLSISMQFPLNRSCVRTLFWWGHDTLQDQEARIKAREDKKVIKWDRDGPETTIEGLNQTTAMTKTGFYAPARIAAEENAMSVGYVYERWNLADHYHVTTYPYFARFKNPHFFACEQRKRDYKKQVEGQRFMRDRVLALGPDLAAAYFLLGRGCRVRFKDHKDWIGNERVGQNRYETSKLDGMIPPTYEPGWYLEAIEATDSKLIYEGFASMKNLTSLKYLDLSYSPTIDSWCMDRITGEYMDTLEYLDLSGCKSIKANALEPIWRLSNLKTLVLRDMDHIKDIKMICLMLLDVFPNLEIRGVDYIDTKLLEGTEDEDLLKDDLLFLNEK